MFWIQIIIPMALALTGLAMLYSDQRGRREFINNLGSTTRKQLVDFGSKQVDKTEIRSRLEEIGKKSDRDYGEFRYMQLIFGAVAALIPFIALFLMALNLVQAISLSVFLGIGTYMFYDRHLSSLVKARRELIEAEFPSIIEMLTLAIAAGETPVGAFARIADRSDAFLSKEFGKVIQEVRNGRPFHESLDEMSRTLKSPSIRRFIDALVMALVRGAPIVEVLHRHVAEARINQRNLVMDKAGKAETTMMIPIVFLILPISVLFALWPSINQLSFFAS